MSIGRPEVKKFIIAEVPIEKAFDAWTEGNHLAQWYCDKVSGWPGLGSKITMTWERFGYNSKYIISEIKPPTKIVYKAIIPGLGTQTITVSIRNYGMGSRIEVVETGPGAEGAEGAGDANSGWMMSMAALKIYLEKYWGRHRRNFFALTGSGYEKKQLMRYYQSEDGLASWLTDSGTIPDDIGEPVNLVLRTGKTVTGKVLVVTDHELIISWDEIQGYIEMKSFEVNSDRKAICIRGSSFDENLSADALKEIEGEMSKALGRLHDALLAENS
ncbi:MAG: SRPBCC domain-containing protein [bacterium]|nr:SRPBCC domain-containing protein [bacterium]